MRRAIIDAALAIVPADWRGAVERDLADDVHAAAWRIAWRAAAIGLRLRAARARDNAAAIDIGRMTPMREFTRDLRFAIRAAVRRPGYALAIIATLAIGIGANTAIFSVFNSVLFRPLPGA